MTLEVKHRIPRLVTGIFFISLFLLSCSNEPKEVLVEIKGQAQGTYYSVKYLAHDKRVSKAQIDSLFVSFDSVLSTYKDFSLISTFNRLDSMTIDHPWFMEMIKQSARVNHRTEGDFDPTVLPLVKAWGFGPDERRFQSDEALDSIRLRVGWDLLLINYYKDEIHLSKKVKGVQLDFNAIAQGYMSDVIADFLDSKGFHNYLIDSGGELKAKGVNQKGNLWTIGIDRPEENNEGRDLIATLTLNNNSVATSGNYRKFYVEDGVKYSHTISPHTGMPVSHSLLSATVVCDSCSLADAYATALMVMGTESAIEFVEKNPDIEAYLIYSDVNGNFKGYKSSGLEGNLEER